MKKLFVLVTILAIGVMVVACETAPTATPVPSTPVLTNTPVPPTVVPAVTATPTLLPAPELVGAFPASAFAEEYLIISPNPEGAEGKIEFPPQQSGNNWVIFQIPGVEGEYHLNIEFADLGAINEWGGEVKFPLAVCLDCPENRGETFSFEEITPLRNILQERGLDWPWHEQYLNTGCFVVLQPQKTITVYYRVGGTAPECPQCETVSGPYGTWCISIAAKVCKEPEYLEGIPRGNIGGHKYVGYWDVSPAGEIHGIPFYNNEWDFFLNAPGHVPTCRWPVGMKGDSFNHEFLWVGEPEYIECMTRVDD